MRPTSRATPRLRTTDGQRIAIRFETELADNIQEGLRRQSEFRGEVSYDPKTLEARSVSLRSIVRGDQLVMGFDAGDFWAPDEIDKLAAEREIRRVEDVDTLRDREASDEEVDRLLAALDEM